MTDPTPGTIPRIGELAPDFEAETTHGTLKFSEWHAPPPRSVDALKQRMTRTDMEHVDFYLGFKKL